MIVCGKINPTLNHKISISDISSSREKEKTLVDSPNKKFMQSFPFALPGKQIAYNMPDRIRNLFSECEKFKKEFTFPSRSQTGNDERFLRNTWEIPLWLSSFDKNAIDKLHWVTYSMGGEYEKWYRASSQKILWTSGSRFYYFKNPSSRWTPQKDWFKKGITYTSLCSTFNARILDGDAVYDNTGPALIPINKDHYAILAWLNSKTIAYILHLLNPTLSFQSSDLGNLPFPDNWSNFQELIGNFSKQIIEHIKERASLFAISDNFVFYSKKYQFNSINILLNKLFQDELERASTILEIEFSIEKLLINAYDLDQLTFNSIIRDQGKFPFSDDPEQATNVYQFALNDLLSSKSYFSIYRNSNGVLLDIFSFLCCKYSLNPKQLTKIAKMEQLPLSFSDTICYNLFSGLVLRIFGHRWPKQIETAETEPVWTDSDGIIPLTLGLPEQPLLDRVRERLPEEFPDGTTSVLEREFEEIMGESLEKWLYSSFFKRHVFQFKKRPIAWQLSSRPVGSTGGRGKKNGVTKNPAFACLVYYHKLDNNTLTALQSQYIRPLRQSYETELRTLNNSALLTPDQSGRRIQLEAWIDELKDFEVRLEQCARDGFASPKLKNIARKEPLDRWTSRDGQAVQPATRAEFETQEMRFDPDLNDGVRVNIAPLQKFGLLAMEVLNNRDLEKAIADRAEWRADERQWCRDGKLSKPGWWR